MICERCLRCCLDALLFKGRFSNNQEMMPKYGFVNLLVSKVYKQTTLPSLSKCLRIATFVDNVEVLFDVIALSITTNKRIHHYIDVSKEAHQKAHILILVITSNKRHFPCLSKTFIVKSLSDWPPLWTSSVVQHVHIYSLL